MHPKICQCCGQRMTETELANPNVCLACDPAVSTRGGWGNEARYLRRFTVDESLTLTHADSGQDKGA